MQYKVINFFGDTYFYEDKSELFDFIDQCLVNSYMGFFRYFTNEFKVTNNFGTKDIPQTFLLYKEETNKSCFRKREGVEFVYVNAHFKILDQNRFAVDLEKLEREYIQSRFGNDKKSKSYQYTPGTKYNGRALKQTKGIKKELIKAVYAEEHFVKIRKKRHKKAENICFNRWNNCRYNYESRHSSWKNKKKTNQWN